jgi:DNA polymerase
LRIALFVPCVFTLAAELEAVRPELIVCLGATAAQSLLGSSFKITQLYGKIQQADGIPPIIATLYPSAILRARTGEDRERDTKIFLSDPRCGIHFLKK